MEILNRIKRRVETAINKHRLVKRIQDGGGKITVSKLVLQGQFNFGRNLYILDEGIDNVTRSQIVILPNAKLDIGDNVGMSQVSITVKKHIAIGNNVKIGAGTMIFDTNFHDTDWRVRRNRELDLKSSKSSPIIIENDCFIGSRSIICKGVTIGARSIIAAGSVVVKDIPADCVAGGNPCKIIKFLKDESNQ